MDTLAAIEQRRSIKHFDPNFKLSDEETKKIFQLAMLSPTAFNIQHWRFVNVSDPELREQIKDLAWGQAQVVDASLLIILTADMKAWEKEPVRYWKNAATEVQDFMLPAIKQYYEGKEQVQRDEVFRSMGIAAQTLMLAAKSMGFDSCPMDGFDFDAVANVINLPKDHVIGQFVVIGKGIQDAWPRPGQLEMNEVVIENTF